MSSTQLFEKATAGDVVEGISRPIRTVGEWQSVETALKSLTRYGVLSLPVTAKRIRERKKYKGVISIADILYAIVFDPAFLKYETDYALHRLSLKDLHKTIDTSILKQPVSHLIGKREESKFLWVFDFKDKLSRVAEYFSTGTHRVLLQRPEIQGGNCILSQSDVVRFISKNLSSSLVKPVAKLSLEELGLANSVKSVITVNPNTSALAAFRKLLSIRWCRTSGGEGIRVPDVGPNSWDLAALPVVDSKGTVVGNLSQSDLRGISTSNLEDLLLPVLEYCKKRNQGELWQPICVTPTTTLGVAIQKIVSCKVHRAWIVDQRKIVGALSLTDIISKFSPYDFSFLSYYQSPLSRL